MDARIKTPAATRVMLVITLVVVAAGIAAFLARPSDRPLDPSVAAPLLALFTALFAARVAGQLLVRARAPGWLPPMGEWHLMPYGLLLPAQIVILALMAWIDVAFLRGVGAPVVPRPALGRSVLALSGVYAGSMVVRYAVRMTRRPAARWFGGTIPIVFHLVLAAYLYVFGRFHASH